MYKYYWVTLLLRVTVITNLDVKTYNEFCCYNEYRCYNEFDCDNEFSCNNEFCCYNEFGCFIEFPCYNEFGCFNEFDCLKEVTHLKIPLYHVQDYCKACSCQDRCETRMSLYCLTRHSIWYILLSVVFFYRTSLLRLIVSVIFVIPHYGRVEQITHISPATLPPIFYCKIQHHSRFSDVYSSL